MGRDRGAAWLIGSSVNRQKMYCMIFYIMAVLATSRAGSLQNSSKLFELIELYTHNSHVVSVRMGRCHM
jgi:hypothetical protein